ncbi:protein arginine N-methyltransferase 2-like isoform X2 [Corticium candelabrum]|uniref:protein arginine N-methyltransferase 2-like isoform X2 n=1 Tax=Corticium candelabrum TaxID=121492 RepID=UPI002E26C061|nr:protein arginine N-methyltransferase 2-like isoform X2 [Corticium candelabrum]
MAAAVTSESSQGNTESILIATSDFQAADDNQLSFKRGDRFVVISASSEHWWWCEARGKGEKGYVPVNHVVTHDRWLEEEAERWQDDEYFDSYGHLVVLDVGCGTGILSMFCAHSGNARKVYAVEASEMANHTEKVVRCNGLEGKVQVIKGKIEDIVLPEKVDVIVSEWMGTLLLFELMLESVLKARNRFLKQGGVMWPSEASLFLVPCSAQFEYDRKLAFWEHQYGFDFSPLIPLAKQHFFSKPVYNHKLSNEDCLSEAQRIVTLDLATVKESEIECVSCSYSFLVKRSGCFHGFASWFEVVFGGFDLPMGEEHIKLCTGPDNQPTHWNQDFFMLDDSMTLEEHDEILGIIVIKRNPYWRRHLKVTFEWSVKKRGGLTVIPKVSKEFLLWR